MQKRHHLRAVEGGVATLVPSSSFTVISASQRHGAPGSPEEALSSCGRGRRSTTGGAKKGLLMFDRTRGGGERTEQAGRGGREVGGETGGQGGMRG